MDLAIDGSQETFVLPAEITGTIYVRVVDTDQSRNEANVDVVRVDEMYLSATG